MTSIVNSFTVATLSSNSYDDLSATIGLLTIFILILLLILRELMRVVGGARRHTWARTLDIAIAPLLITFALIIIARLLSLIFRYQQIHGSG